MTNLDHYLAGIFDGEGCVCMSLAKAGYITVQAKVAMCDRAAVAALHARFGGAFEDGNQVTRTGRKVYTWTVFNCNSVEALTMFSELCLVRKAVASAALPIAISMRDNPTRSVVSQVEKAARIEAAKFIASINKPVGARRILDPVAVEAYMQPKQYGGGKRVRLSDGREFRSVSDAARALGVTISAVSFAHRKKSRTVGVLVEVL